MPQSLARAVVANFAIYFSTMISVVVGSGMVLAEEPRNPAFDSPTAVAAALLDDAIPTEQRQKLVDDRQQPPAATIRALLADLKTGTSEEYRRIPWIWRVAVASGRRNEGDELKELLDVALPSDDEPLEDWQAVVIGGGIIGGLSDAGLWPSDRVRELIADNASLRSRWQRAVDAAVSLAEDPQVPTGTRYDALRMIAMVEWDTAEAVLLRYAEEGVDDELQMGAISAAGDVPDPRATQLLISVVPYTQHTNRGLALDALLRTPDRCLRLLEAVGDGTIPAESLGETRVATLRQHNDPRVRAATAVAIP